MSVLEYNSVRFHFAKTAAIDFDTQRDKTGTDVIANTTTIRVRGVASLTSFPPENSAALLPTICHMLNMPRRSLLYQVAGTTVIAWQQGGVPDALNGPTPVKPATVEPAGNGTFFVDVAYKVGTYDCGNADLTDPVTSLRWTQSESFDDRWFSTINTSGTLVVRADLRQQADNFRNLCTPPVLSDYQRTGAKYTLAPDGLSLDFEFTDVEKSMLPPYPAIKADGKFTVSCPRPGSIRVGSIEITLEGAKGTNRKDLFTVALAMAYSKLRSEGFEGVPVTWGNFSEKLFEPSVTVSMQANLSPLGGSGFGGSALIALGSAASGGSQFTGPAVMRSVGYTPGTQEGKPGIAPPVRKRLLGLLAAAFKDPCAAADGVQIELRNSPGGSSANTDLTTGATSTPTRPADLVTGPTGVAGRSPIRDYAPYDVYMIRYEYVWDTGRRVLPGTGVGEKPQVGAAVTNHGGWMQLHVSWYAQRSGKPPVVPAFGVNDPNLVPHGGVASPAEMQLSADGSSPVFRMAGHYVYGVLNPSLVSISSPVPPHLTEAVLTTAGNVAAFPGDVIKTQKGEGYSGGGDYGPGSGSTGNIFVAGGTSGSTSSDAPVGQPVATINPPILSDLWGIPGPVGGGFPNPGGFLAPPGGLGDSIGGAVGGLLPVPNVNP